MEQYPSDEISEGHRQAIEAKDRLKAAIPEGHHISIGIGSARVAESYSPNERIYSVELRYYQVDAPIVDKMLEDTPDLGVTPHRVVLDSPTKPLESDD